MPLRFKGLNANVVKTRQMYEYKAFQKNIRNMIQPTNIYQHELNCQRIYTDILTTVSFTSKLHIFCKHSPPVHACNINDNNIRYTTRNNLFVIFLSVDFYY